MVTRKLTRSVFVLTSLTVVVEARLDADAEIATNAIGNCEAPAEIL